jgi:hypothetical protein
MHVIHKQVGKGCDQFQPCMIFYIKIEQWIGVHPNHFGFIDQFGVQSSKNNINLNLIRPFP